MFLTIEGSEGVGKSTAMKLIQIYLSAANVPVVMTREPGGTPTAEQIRKILLTPDGEEKLVPATELLLMFASRAQHIANLIKPALAAGKWVVSDRFVDASYAYQGGGRGFDLARIAQLDSWIVGNIMPDVTILLDAPPKIGLARAKKREVHDRIEQEQIDFFERVREGYLARAKADAKRFKVIDATQSLAAVHGEIKLLLDKLIQEKSGAE
jgi:dTMP kinase